MVQYRGRPRRWMCRPKDPSAVSHPILGLSPSLPSSPLHDSCPTVPAPHTAPLFLHIPLQDGRVPLIKAAKIGYFKAVEVLIGGEADLEAKDEVRGAEGWDAKGGGSARAAAWKHAAWRVAATVQVAGWR